MDTSREVVIFFATSNPYKRKELNTYLRHFMPKVKLLTLDDVHWPLSEVDETSPTFEGNAALKQEAFLQTVLGMQRLNKLSWIAGKLVIVAAEDSGLVVDALKRLPSGVDDAQLPEWSIEGLPGVISKRWCGPLTTERYRNQILLKELGEVPLEERTARYVCSFAATTLDGQRFQHRGVWEGHLSLQPKGSKGSGYDNLFVPHTPNTGRTAAQMSLREKNGHSHRGQAFQELLWWIEQLPA